MGAISEFLSHVLLLGASLDIMVIILMYLSESYAVMAQQQKLHNRVGLRGTVRNE
jgi:hypothetical protein